MNRLVFYYTAPTGRNVVLDIQNIILGNRGLPPELETGEILNILIRINHYINLMDPNQGIYNQNTFDYYFHRHIEDFCFRLFLYWYMGTISRTKY